MTTYHVRWEIEVEGETPRDAAIKAFDTLNTGVTLEVTGNYETFRIDFRADLINYLVTGLYENTGQRYAGYFLAESAEQAEQLCAEATANTVTITAVINVNTGEVAR